MQPDSREKAKDHRDGQPARSRAAGPAEGTGTATGSASAKDARQIARRPTGRQRGPQDRRSPQARGSTATGERRAEAAPNPSRATLRAGLRPSPWTNRRACRKASTRQRQAQAESRAGQRQTRQSDPQHRQASAADRRDRLAEMPPVSNIGIVPIHKRRPGHGPEHVSFAWRSLQQLH